MQTCSLVKVDAKKSIQPCASPLCIEALVLWKIYGLEEFLDEMEREGPLPSKVVIETLRHSLIRRGWWWFDGRQRVQRDSPGRVNIDGLPCLCFRKFGLHRIRNAREVLVW